jgi:hypothetical protein
MRVHPWMIALALCATSPCDAQLSFADRPLSFRGRVVTPDSAAAGRVVRGDSANVRPVPNAWVVLHRVVGTDGGPVDSVQTDRAGRYALSFVQPAGDSARYFASTTFAGITYFTASATQQTHEGDGDLAVFDTTSVPFALTVRGRHVIVRSADSTGRRTVIEVFELSNDSARTLLARDADDAPPTFKTELPSSATDVRAGDGDVSADAIRVRDGHVLVTAPFSPGVKQLSFSYVLPAGDGALELMVPSTTSVLEVLLEDSTATVSGGRLRPTEPVTVEARRFQRAIAQDVAAGTRVRVVLPVTARMGLPLNGVALAVGAGAFALLLLMRRNARRVVPNVVGPSRSLAGADLPEQPDDLARAIADLDAHYQRTERPTDAMRLAYEQRRRELKDALADAMRRTR